MYRKSRLHLMIVLAILLGVAGVGLSRLQPSSSAGGQDGAAAQPEEKGQGKGSHEQDIAAIKKAMKSFIEAFEKGDAKAVAAHWTSEGEYVADDGTKYQGRKELEKVYTEYFVKNKNLKVAIDMESVRFPSANTAVEEGTLKLRKAKSGDFVASKYSVLHVKEDGKWLMAIVREWPGEGVSLHNLDWLIGTWQSKRDDVEVLSTYTWGEQKHFLLMNFTIKEKDRTIKGKQYITRDASTGLLRSWTFEDHGSFAEGVWVHEGKKWMIDSSGVLPSGARLTATNIMTPLDENNFLWQSVERTLDEEPLPDVAPVKVTRVKSTK